MQAKSPMKVLGAVSLLCGILMPASVMAQDVAPPIPPPGVRFVPDVTYCKLPCGRALQLDIAFPARMAGPYPTVVIYHGTGKWSRGRKYNLPQVFELAQKGFVAVAVSYRHLPEEPFPQAIHDAKCSIRWLRAHAKKYQIDPNAIGAVGFSGGGSLALLLSLMPADKEFEGDGGCPDQSSAVQAAVAYFAPTDLIALVNHKPVGWVAWGKASYVQQSLSTWLGGGVNEVPKHYHKASPVTYLRKDAAPILLVHGEMDDMVPVEQSRTFAAKLNALTKRVDTLFLNAPHDFDAIDCVATHMAKSSSHVFLEQHLRRKIVANLK